MRTKIVIIFIFILWNISLFAQVSGNLLKVQGESIISETPEQMIINIPITVKDSSYNRCSDNLIEKYNLLIAELTKNGIEKENIISDMIEINENISYTDRQRKFEGYNGKININLNLKYNTIKLNKIIKSLKNKSLNLTYYVNFQLSEEQKKNLLQKAIDMAIKDATNKAKLISESLNLKLIEIKDINFGYTNNSNDVLVEDMHICYSVPVEIEDSGAGKITLNPQKMQISKSIGIVWQISK